jgi:hypothetical protein
MGTAKVISMTVRPCQVAHLCFELDGILEVSNAQLGAPVLAFNFPAFYAILGLMPTVDGDSSLLLYNFPEIDGAVAPFALVALRKEGRKVALAKAINSRQNAYHAKYGHITDIVSQMHTNYSPSVTGSKMQRLQILAGIATDQWNLLQAAYQNDSRTGVVKTTKSILGSTTLTSGSSHQTGTNTETGGNTDTGQSNTEDIQMPSGGQTGAAPASGAPFNFPMDTGVPVDFGWGTSSEKSNINDKTKIDETTTNKGKATETQTIVNTDYGYRVPYREATAQFERAQISLIDQQFTQFVATLNLPNLAQVLQNELDNIDGDVYRFQIAYLNTILMSPIAGIVTGVYKQPGDAVRASEPVVRVEDNSSIFILASVVYRGPIVIGSVPPAPPVPNSTVTVHTKLFDLSPLPAPLTGTVVAVTGHGEDDRWELIVKCNNLDSSGNPIFPLGYRFDYDDTTISIS